MNPNKRVLLLVLILFSVVVVVEAITISVLYKVAFNEEKARLREIVTSHARLIESIARFDEVYSNDYPYGARQATLDQIKDAHAQYAGFGETGEFTLSTRENDQIVFLLSHRHSDLDKMKPVLWNSNLAEPMKMALSGKSGTIIGYDYRGVKVLAAHEPVRVLNLGIVAKIDLEEIRAPFIRAALISGVSALVLIALGVSLFFKVTNPILKGLYDTIAELKIAQDEVKTLRGVLPICSFCKNIREDDGSWTQMESYVRQRSNAEFSHGICPECARKHYPEIFENIES